VEARVSPGIARCRQFQLVCNEINKTDGIQQYTNTGNINPDTEKLIMQSQEDPGHKDNRFVVYLLLITVLVVTTSSRLLRIAVNVGTANPASVTICPL
jgi:hypothetical protein